MNNFQLYRTNLYLGGQMKWDIIIDSSSNSLYVSDFHLSPISSNIPYLYQSDENLLINSHQDNVKSYYKAIQSNFYEEGLDPEFKHPWPIICKKNNITNCYSNTYNMGCKRADNYSKYKKQFEFFCPVWIENLNKDIEFKISISSKEEPDIILAKNSLKLSLNKKEIHNKFVNYFKSYIEYIGVDKGNDDICNVNFTKKFTAINGFDVSSGLVVTKQIPDFVNNITLRERPLMEVDSLLMESFKTNTLIAKQLFNFNLCFNLEDIVSGSIVKLIHGMPLTIHVDVYIGEKLLEKKDFYSEYEFISKDIIYNNVSDNNRYKFNVLDYFKDYSCIDFMTKNKFCQKICHWSLFDNSNYIFNVYNGFSGITVQKLKDDDVLIENKHNYCNAPDIITKVNNAGQNTIGWINSYNVNSWKDFNKFIADTKNYKKLGTFIHSDIKYLNNLKYVNVPKIDKPFYAVNLIVSQKLFYIISNNIKDDLTALYEDKVYIIVKDDLLIIITTDSNQISFGKFFDILDKHNKNDFESFVDTEYIDNEFSIDAERGGELKLDVNVLNDIDGELRISDSENEKINHTNENGITLLTGNTKIDTTKKDFLKSIYNLMLSVVQPNIVTFGGSLYLIPAESPSKDSTEVSYIKDNFTKDYVIRYDGKIKPTFVDQPSTLYYKDYISDDRTNGKSNLQNSDYAKYIKTGIPAIYPSINYGSIKKLSKYSFEELPKVKVSEYDEPVVLIEDKNEYKWFNDGLIRSLDPKIVFTYENKLLEDGTYRELDLIVHELIKDYYKLQDDDTVNYIISKYMIENNWEYASDMNIKDYIYKITLKLK